MRRVSLIVLLLSAAGLFAQQQNELPQFRAGVELIQLDVAVLDGKRQPVRGLIASDFTVLDNGVATSIRAFTPIEIASRTGAAETAWASTIPPDVATNDASEQEGRLVIILMDRSIPPHAPTFVARRIATATVDGLGPHDLAAVVSTSNGTVQNLTADRSRLRRAIDTGDPSTDISEEAKGIFVAMGVPLDPLSDGRCLCGLCVHETITRVADAVRTAPRRRKVLLFIGSSVIWQAVRPAASVGQDVGCENRLEDARKTMFAAVDRANLTVHSIDPKELVNIGPQTRASTPGGFDRPIASGPAVRMQQQKDETARTMTDQQSLQVLPERTGGRTVVNRNNPEEVVPAILRESEAYYVLGVERATSNRSNDSRSIQVKVGRKGVRVYAQRQYIPAATPANATVAQPAASSARSPQEALNRLLPSGSVPLALAVTPFAPPDRGKALVRVNLDVRAFANSDGTGAPLDIVVLAVDATGKPVAAARQTSTVTTPSSAATAADVNVQSHLELAPGEYGIRIAVADQARGALASVFSDVTVPEFDKAPLSLSGIAVDVARTASAAPAPTTRRAFQKSERVRAVLQIYQGTERTDPLVPVSMRVQILDAKGAAVRDQSLPFAEQAFTNRRADCIVTLPLASLPAGDYALKLEASGDRRTAGRALRFSVE